MLRFITIFSLCIVVLDTYVFIFEFRLHDPISYIELVHIVHFYYFSQIFLSKSRYAMLSSYILMCLFYSIHRIL